MIFFDAGSRFTIDLLLRRTFVRFVLYAAYYSAVKVCDATGGEQ